MAPASLKRVAMKSIKMAVLITGLAVTSSAHAWFFIFIPGSATRAISDSFTGAKGNICVKDGTRAGDVLTSGGGNTAKVLSVSGTSSICKNPATPIRAELEFTYNFASKSGIELSDDYEAKPITDLERFNGFVLKAISKNTKNQGVQVSSVAKKPNDDLQTRANSISENSLKNINFKEVRADNSEQIVINGTKAVRWEIIATLRGLFGQDVTYMYTLLEGDHELVLLNAYTPTSNYAARKAEFSKLAEGVRGLHDDPNDAAKSEELIQEPAPALTATENTENKSEIQPKTVSTSGLESVEDRLAKLDQLLKAGLISKAEYTSKRADILKSL
jgi:hypothetical protein